MSAADLLAAIRAGWAHNEPTENEVIMADALDAVLALHAPQVDEPQWCRECRCDVCADDHVAYPCPTVAAITDALGEDA